MRHILPLLLLLLVPLSAHAQAAGDPAESEFTYKYKDLAFRKLWSPLPTNNRFADGAEHGYVEYRFEIRNGDKGAAHTVTLSIPGERRTSSDTLRMSRTIEVPAGSTVEISLFQPNLPFSRGYPARIQIAVAVDGSPQQSTIRVENPLRTSISSGDRYGVKTAILSDSTVLIPLKLIQEFENGLGRAAGVVVVGMGRSDVNIIRAEGSLKNWSKHWLAYSCLDGIVLKGKELETAPPEVRTAIWQYVESGGSLLLIGSCKLPAGWQEDRGRSPRFHYYRGGFGECLVAKKKDVAGFDKNDFLEVAQSWNSTASPWRSVTTASGAAQLFEVIEKRGLPVVSLLLIMIVATVLIGPLNLYLLSAMRKRIWVLWTMPALSFVACFSVFAYMLLYEGWQSYTRIEGVTVLDENSQRATTLGWFGVYAPLTPGSGLHFDSETEVTPLMGRSNPRGNRETEGLRTINWTVDQHLASGWVTARVPSYLQLRRSERRRERVLVRREKNGKRTMVNGLKAKIQDIWLMDKAGMIAHAKSVEAGAEAALESSPVKRDEDSERQTLRKLYEGGNWNRIFGMMKARPENLLEPGTYVALLDGTPFFQEGLAGAVQRNSRSVVFGIMKDSSHEN